jgi:hypothetical protein
LRWHRTLVAKNWDYSDRKEKQLGRPRIRQVVVDLTVKLAKENATWGFDRIQGELAKVGYPISDTTISDTTISDTTISDTTVGVSARRSARRKRAAKRMLTSGLFWTHVASVRKE